MDTDKSIELNAIYNGKDVWGRLHLIFKNATKQSEYQIHIYQGNNLADIWLVCQQTFDGYYDAYNTMIREVSGRTK